MIDAGERLIRTLDRRGTILDSALWWLSRIQAALLTVPNAPFDLTDVSVLDSSDPLIVVLKGLTRTGKAIAAIRVQRSILNNLPVEDAYIYRLS
jgi:hypothetical protein